jgi:hypothetical protein
MKSRTIKEAKTTYSTRFPKTNLSSVEYEKFIRASYSVMPPARMTLAKQLKYAAKVKFKLD